MINPNNKTDNTIIMIFFIVNFFTINIHLNYLSNGDYIIVK